MTKVIENLKLSDTDVQDSGCAIVGTLSDNKDTGVFIRVQSWDDDKKHDDYKVLGLRKSKKYRVTIEEM